MMNLGADVSKEDWSRLFSDPSHQEWIVQQYHQSIQYESMNLSGMLFCCNHHCFNIGPIRLSQNKIVHICNGGYYIRPFVHRRYVHRSEQNKILTKTELHKQLELSRWSHQHWNRGVYVSSSGGSGGKRLFFATDIQENQRQREILVDMMISANVLSELDVCLNLFHSDNIYRSLEIFNDFCSLAYCTVLPMGSTADDDKILKIIEYFRPNVLMGSPYRLMQLALFIEKHYPTNKKIHFEKIFFACEPLDNLKRDYFKRVFHCSTCLGFYGSAEAGVFACQTPDYANTQLYMYPKDLVQVDITDGQIIVTNLVRRRNQLIQFNTGDLGRLIPNDDNEKYGLIEVRQSQRLIDLTPGSIMKSDIEECMNQLDLIEWQLIIENEPHNNNRTILTFRYIEKTTAANIEHLKTHVKNYLIRTLGSSLVIEDYLTIQFESIPYQALIRDQTSNKLLKMIDRRS
jgi:phenylacetate-coenzyme A ligase PaaK-like adenylate-forming protein